ncbi:MAG: C-GCAxxG-C-C family (seleno)protein [Desulfovibrionales bacterium]
MSNKGSGFSRRNFLSGMGVFAAGAVAGSGLGLFPSPGSDSSHASQGEIPKWPWPYAAIDPERARKKGHLGYYEGKCSQGAFSAIVSELQENVGWPYTMLPVQMMAYGSGGVAGWCTLCGAVNGACAAITLVSKNYKELCDELLKWYVSTPFPSDVSNSYAENHEFLVEKYKTDKPLPKTVPGSPLCHVTVTRWCREHNFASGSSERSERCARISGDVAAFAAGLLNRDAEQTFSASLKYSDAVQSCRSCHAKGKDLQTGGWSRGKMECYDCHNLNTAKFISPEEHFQGK